MLDSLKKWNWVLMLQTQVFSVGQVNEPCIGLIQENLIENSVQDCLSYILIPSGLCELFIAYPKQLCIYLKINICFIYYMTSFFQNILCSSIYLMTCDCVIWCDLLYNSVLFFLFLKSTIYYIEHDGRP